jgi:hypothetical protein
MNLWKKQTAILALTTALCGGPLFAAEAEKKPITEIPSFGVLQASAPEAARAQALEWLKSTGKVDDAMQKAFDANWASDRPVLDKVADTFALANPEAAKLLAEARDEAAAAPTKAPVLTADPQPSPWMQANFALAYAKALSTRRVHDQVLETLQGVKPGQTVDPATYYFIKAVSEHALMQKDAAESDLNRLLTDVAADDVPLRYKTVAALMADDMDKWHDQDELADIAREMGVIKDRLDLSRGGEKTRKLQDDVVARLDEIIKEMEKEKDGPKIPVPADPNAQPQRPADDSVAIGIGAGEGRIDMRKLNQTAAQWGKLGDKERAEAMKELTRDLPPDLRDTVSRFFQELTVQGAAIQP